MKKTTTTMFYAEDKFLAQVIFVLQNTGIFQ